MAKVLFHIDLNAFFASAEELRHPEYVGKPMAVGSAGPRGVLATANYEARKLGVHSAMPTMQAKAMVPELTIVQGDHAYYKSLSRQFFDYLRQYTGKIEILSIDECYMDVTDIIKQYKRPLDLAVSIQQGVYDKLKLKCSIGVAPNRFLAKMASDMRKPMGITVLRKSELSNKLWPLDIDQMIGIGTRTLPKLKEQGIETIGDLADPANEAKVLSVMKKSGWEAIQKARGHSSDELAYSSSRKSVSLSRTYNVDIYTLEEMFARIEEIAADLSRKMQKDHLEGALISLVLRDIHFKNTVRSINLHAFTSRYETIAEACRNLAAENFEPVGYRHIGISVGSLKGQTSIIEQPTIFEESVTTTSDVIARLNKTLDSKAFMKASDLLKEKKND